MLTSSSDRPILVTGGAGFLGTHLCERLLSDGHYVVALDNFSSGSMGNVLPLAKHPRFTVVRQDVSANTDLQPSCIFNLACPASPPFYQRDPIGTTLTSVVGIWRMLELARRLNIRVLQASTSEVYGEPAAHPQPEAYRGNVSTTGPRACYDEGKRCAEALCFDYLRQHGTAIRVARIFNTYGPGMQPDDGRVITNFIVQALLDEDITLYGDGCQSRSFCFVDDMIEGLVRLMDSAVNGPVNLGNPHEVSMHSLAQLIVTLSGSQSRLVYRPLPADDPSRRCPDIALAYKSLDWQPCVSLEQGLTRTIASLRKIVANGETPLPQALWMPAQTPSP